MPRANRYLVQHQIYHVTHRCHDREFLLRFGRDRNAYCRWLREGLKRFEVSLFNYSVTSNHVHLLLVSDRPEHISGLIDLVHGTVGGQYNRRKARSGGFWTDRYHITAVDGGDHLWHCLRYIDLNMVRANAVPHPEQWRWSGFLELMGERRRCQLLAIDELLLALGGISCDEFRKIHRQQIAQALQQRQLEREARWTESLAVGSLAFVERVRARMLNRRRMLIESEQSHSGLTIWRVCDPTNSYGNFLAENAPLIVPAVKE